MAFGKPMHQVISLTFYYNASAVAFENVPFSTRPFVQFANRSLVGPGEGREEGGGEVKMFSESICLVDSGLSRRAGLTRICTAVPTEVLTLFPLPFPPL